MGEVVEGCEGEGRGRKTDKTSSPTVDGEVAKDTAAVFLNGWVLFQTFHDGHDSLQSALRQQHVLYVSCPTDIETTCNNTGNEQ